MKKFFNFLLACVMVVSMIGCQQTEPGAVVTLEGTGGAGSGTELETTVPDETEAPSVLDVTEPDPTEDPSIPTEPEATEPPVTEAPVTAPPVTQPPATEPEEPKPVSTGKVNFTDVSEAVRTTGYVNVRSGPGSSYKKLDSLPDNYSLLRTGVGDNGWSRVIYNGKEAYISTNYLLFEEECDYGPDELLEMYPLERCLCDIVLAESRYCPAFCEGPAYWYVRCQNGHRMYLTIPGSEPTGHNYVDGICTRCGRADPDTVEEIDYEDIGKAAMKYINQYRAQEGSTQLTWLPGMSQVAQYRSVQLTTNFAHDTGDIREALAFYEYGEYIDMTVHGLPASENYWSAHSQEAIGRGVLGTTADAIGKYIADLFHRSSGHWSYVGSSEYSYIGVGYTDGYVCVMVGRVNYG